MVCMPETAEAEALMSIFLRYLLRGCVALCEVQVVNSLTFVPCKFNAKSNHLVTAVIIVSVGVLTMLLVFPLLRVSILVSHD